ncbi:protein RER1A-like isoform X5 [Triticum urartu]|uniref:protein RER1A-like isoform X5 n=1 Tax=Triticum urartu TaxID=4572 RepID=UPI0020440ACC|nr:protein RER1A-like isoform X5 [Triticum urartu]
MTTQALAPPPPEPHTAGRWAGTLLAAAVYAPRVYYVQGFYVVSYGLSIYRLNLLIGFLSPMVDPELEALDQAGPALPTCGNNEFKPFIRRLPEFKFWYLPGWCVEGVRRSLWLRLHQHRCCNPSRC